MDNSTTIDNFYKSFARYDAEGMVSLYADTVEFNDPVFGLLKGEKARNMWRMLIERGKGTLKIQHHNIEVENEKGSCEWVAVYIYKPTGRKVTNKIKASFEFKDGKIVRHTDNFDIWNWSKQALGPIGFLLGFTGFLKNKIGKMANLALDEFSS